MFQNFIHAIRGVAPRTVYDSSDISEYLLLTDREREEIEQKPAGEPIPSITEEKTEIKVSTNYEHVAPGKYSEIYVIVTANPGPAVRATLSGPGVDSSATQNQTADDEGVVNFTWHIISYGTYNVSGTVNGESFNSSINVK